MRQINYLSDCCSVDLIQYYRFVSLQYSVKLFDIKGIFVKDCEVLVECEAKTLKPLNISNTNV